MKAFVKKYVNKRDAAIAVAFIEAVVQAYKQFKGVA